MRIYDFYFDEIQSCILELFHDDCSLPKVHGDVVNGGGGSSLLRTCKAIYIEALPVLHTQCRLRIACHPEVALLHLNGRCPRNVELRGLLAGEQRAFLASIVRAEIHFFFDHQTEVDFLLFVQEVLRQAVNIEQLTILIGADPDEDHDGPDFRDITALFSELSCRRKVKLAFDPQSKVFLPEDKRCAMLLALNAYVDLPSPDAQHC